MLNKAWSSLVEAILSNHLNQTQLPDILRQLGYTSSITLISEFPVNPIHPTNPGSDNSSEQSTVGQETRNSGRTNKELLVKNTEQQQI
jgi:hypothetical protein